MVNWLLYTLFCVNIFMLILNAVVVVWLRVVFSESAQSKYYVFQLKIVVFNCVLFALREVAFCTYVSGFEVSMFFIRQFDEVLLSHT